MSGYKTYIIGLLLIFLALAKGFGFVPTETYQDILGILNGLGLLALRSGIASDCKM